MPKLAILVTCIVVNGAAFALDQPVVDMTAQPAQVAVGDRVTVTITYRWPSGWHATEPNPTDAFAETFVVDCPPPERAHTAEEDRRTWKLVTLATRSGSWSLPRPVLHTISTKGPVDTQANAVAVQVGTDAAPAQPAAARPLWTAGGGEVEPRRWLAAVAAGVLAIAALIAWWLLGRRRILNSESPGDRLRRELAQLAGLRDGKEISAQLGLALRRWCGTVFAYDGPVKTTRETLAQLRSALKDDEYTTLGRLLGDLDDVRWAAGVLDAGTVLPLSERALAWSDGVQSRITAALVVGDSAAGLAPNNAPLALPPRRQG